MNKEDAKEEKRENGENEEKIAISLFTENATNWSD